MVNHAEKTWSTVQDKDGQFCCQSTQFCPAAFIVLALGKLLRGNLQSSKHSTGQSTTHTVVTLHRWCSCC